MLSVNDLPMVVELILVYSDRTLVSVVNYALKNGKLFIFTGKKFFSLNKIPMFVTVERPE